MFILFRLFDLSNVFAMIGAGFFVAFGVDKAIEFLMEKTNIINFLQTKRKQKDEPN
jgi:prefoldin subunit 5